MRKSLAFGLAALLAAGAAHATGADPCTRPIDQNEVYFPAFSAYAK
jgi:hypothetical protein